MSDLAGELKKAREARKMSLQDLAASTKIVTRYLDALENDRFDLMPGGFFLKAIIRSYSTAVGLDADEILKKYSNAGIIPAFSEAHPGRARDLSAFSGKNKLIVWSVIITGLFFAAVVLTLLFKPDRRPVSLPAHDSSIKTGQIELLPPAPSPQENQPAAEEKKPTVLLLEISLTDLTWMRIYSDGALIIDGLFPAGRTLSAKADKEFLIEVGNAGGFTYKVNGKNGKSLGLEGQVKKNIRINIDNLDEFTGVVPDNQDPDRLAGGPAPGLF